MSVFHGEDVVLTEDLVNNEDECFIPYSLLFFCFDEFIFQILQVLLLSEYHICNSMSKVTSIAIILASLATAARLKFSQITASDTFFIDNY
jgi:hypothetical protein